MKTLYIENHAHCCFSNDSTHFFILSFSANASYDSYSGTVDPGLIFSFMSKVVTFLVSKGLVCLYDKQNNTWLLVDMKFLF